jgi:phosphoribosylaminoimidazole (AIR) synthetase
MGIGLVVFIAPGDLARAAEIWKSAGQRWFAIGNVKSGRHHVFVEPPPA